MELIESFRALQLTETSLGAERPASLIHHCDRGIQYCSWSYIKLLNENKVQISMTEIGGPLENAVAERVNGIIKDEYQINSIYETKKRATQGGYSPI